MNQVNKESIRTRTMRRVVAVYYLKKVINRFTLKMGLIALTLFAFGSLVHVAAVLNNMPSFTDIGALLNFGTIAFINTGVAVQAVILALGAVTLWLLKDVFAAIHMPIFRHSHVNA